MFDFFAGTSTGGVIAIGLTVPDLNRPNKPRYWAYEIENLYVAQGAKIFSNTFSHVITILDGLIGPKYDIVSFKKVLDQVIGDLTLDKVVKDLIIVSFDITTHKHFLFSNINNQTIHNSCLVDIALSTAAAPYYFPAHKVLQENLVDGGILANNPSIWAYFEALKYFPQAKNREIYVVFYWYRGASRSSGH